MVTVVRKQGESLTRAAHSVGVEELTHSRTWNPRVRLGVQLRVEQRLCLYKVLSSIH